MEVCSYNATTISDVHFPVTTLTEDNVSALHDPDFHVITSGGLRIPVHSSVLVSSSPVLENCLNRSLKHQSCDKVIQIPGVPCGAVSSFVGFLYTSRCTEEQMEKYGIHLLALAHVYAVPHLKQRCSKGLCELLTIENVVDVLQLARLCDAPDLYLKCMKLIASCFKAVEMTEGWKFLQDHDPWLELQILQFMDEAESRRKRTRRQRKEQSVYLQLSEAMECLEHICREGCTSVGPYDVDPSKKGPCSKFATCEGLQQLIRHFATCKKRANGGCLRCKRMLQLLRLHSSICQHPDSCRVPLCRQFELKAQTEKKGDGAARWKLLVRRVVSAKIISAVSQQQQQRMACRKDFKP